MSIAYALRVQGRAGARANHLRATALSLYIYIYMYVYVNVYLSVICPGIEETFIYGALEYQCGQYEVAAMVLKICV